MPRPPFLLLPLALLACDPGPAFTLSLRPIVADDQEVPSGALTLVVDDAAGRALVPSAPSGPDLWDAVDVDALDGASVGLLFTDEGARVDPPDWAAVRAWGRSGVASVAEGEDTLPVLVGAWGRVGGFGALDEHTAVVAPAAVVLPDGDVWIVGGAALHPAPTAAAPETTDQVLRLSRLDDTATFDRTGDVPVLGQQGAARVGATATLVPTPDGPRVLLVGGRTAWPSLAGGAVVPALVDPATGAFTATSPLSRGRSQHEALRRPDGSVLVLGGWEERGAVLLDVDRFDPSTGTFVAGPRLTEVGSIHFGAALLPSGDVVVCGGGITSSGVLAGTTGCRLIPADDGEPVTLPPLPAGLAGNALRLGHAAVALDATHVLVTGGITGALGLAPSPATRDAFVLDVDAARAGDPAAWRTVGPLGEGRALHRLLRLPDGRVLVLGGTGAVEGFPPSGAPLACGEVYDPATEAFAPLEPCAPAATGAHLVVADGPDGAFVLAGPGGEGDGRAWGLIPTGPAPTP